MKSENKLSKIFLYIAWFVIAYVGVSLFAFSYRNPELTQMQIWMRFADAMFWQ
jgi:hypothetical protein